MNKHELAECIEAARRFREKGQLRVHTPEETDGIVRIYQRQKSAAEQRRHREQIQRNMELARLLA